MGLILDTSVLIAGERRGQSVAELLKRVRSVHGEMETALSAITVVELTHGIYRAKTEEARERRRAFTEELYRDIIVHPVSLEIAQAAGRIEGEQAAVGNVIAFEDVVIAATALHLGFSLATLNLRHFERVPGLTVVTL